MRAFLALIAFLMVFASERPAWAQMPPGASAVDIIDRQIAAYNNGDIEGFVSTYHPDIRLINADGEIILEGLDALRDRYEDFFVTEPDHRVTILSRQVMGSVVADREWLTGLSTGEPVEALVVYQVHDGLIHSAIIMRVSG